MEDPVYQSIVSEGLAGAENAWMNLLMRTKLRSGHKKITVVDCGPASPEESIRKLTKLMRAVTVAQYVAIDMNAHLLAKIRLRVSGATGIPTKFIQSRFEDLDHDSLADVASEEVLILFGSTEMNYEPEELALVLQRFCAPGMLLAVESLLLTDGGSTAGYESEAVQQFAFGPLWLLNAHRDQFDFNALFLDGRIILEYRAKCSIVFNAEGYPALREGDAVWTAFSRRPTLVQHRADFGQLAETLGTLVTHGRIASSLGRFR